MPGKRVIYRNLIAETSGRSEKIIARDSDDKKRTESSQIESAVWAALERLSSIEKEFVERFYFQGQTYLQIARVLNRRESHMAGIHRRSLARLRQYLAPFVCSRFGIKRGVFAKCPLCNSPHVDKIDALIRSKGVKNTWRNVMRRLKSDFNCDIRTPQILMTHQKYHMEED